MPPLRIWQLVFLESSLMGNDSRSYLAHQSLPQGWLHHMLQDRRGDTINSFIPGWEHVRFLPASQKFVSSPVEVVSTKKNQKGVMWYLVVIHLLGYPGILSFGQEGDSPVLPREVEGTNGEFLTISTSIRSRSVSQPFTTEGLANPDHPRSIVQAKASLLDSFRNQRQSGQSWSRTLRKRGIQKHQILNVSRVQIYMSFIEFPYLGFPSH